MQLELDGVTVFCFPDFADFMSFSAFACLSSSISLAIAAFSTSMSLPVETIRDGVFGRLDAVPLLNLIFTFNDSFGARCRLGQAHLALLQPLDRVPHFHSL